MHSKTRKVLPALGAAAVMAFTACQAATPQDATIIPHADWTSYMPEGIPYPENGNLIFELNIPLERATDIGRTQYGQRSIAVGEEGSIAGPKLSGKVMEGALDYALTLTNGTIEIEDILVLQTPDGGYVMSRSAGVGPNADDIRVVMDFEAPSAGEYAWLNTGKFVARRDLDAAAGMLTLSVYDVTEVPISTADAIRIEKPAGVPPQPWDFRRKGPSEMQGDVLIVENVTLAPSQSVGMSKRGNRNIIPITGGTVTGKINGTVVKGGADYQNFGGEAGIDARYMWQANDGEIIIIRNTGSGSLVPTFETRVDGPYAYLNDNLYLSSPPGMGQGGVSITFYESTN